MAETNSTIIALDVGSKRVGVATADAIARLPQTHSVLDVDETIYKKITKLAHDLSASIIVIGIPRNLENKDTQQTSTVRKFKEELSNHLNLPIYLQDEALTSRQAEEILQSKGKSYSKGEVDSLAATLILDDFLRDSAIAKYES